jgi:hypothetical protein
MKQLKTLTAAAFAVLTVGAYGNAVANTELLKMQKNPNDWVMPSGDYANTRYSE